MTAADVLRFGVVVALAVFDSSVAVAYGVERSATRVPGACALLADTIGIRAVCVVGGIRVLATQQSGSAPRQLMRSRAWGISAESPTTCRYRVRCIDPSLKALRRVPRTVKDAGLRSDENEVGHAVASTGTWSRRHSWDRGSRFGLGALVGVALTLAGCASGDDGNAAGVEPIAAILASDISIEVDPSGTAATFTVDTTIPVACSVVYGTDGSFGSLAVDNDMQGGAHQDHGPLLIGLTPDTEYQYRLQGADEAGTLYRSDVMTFRTPAAVESALGSNIATAATVTASSSSFSDQFTPERAIDGDLATEWSTAGDGDDAWIEIDLGETREITGVAFRTRQMSDGTAITDTFTITVDDDSTFGPYPAGADATAFDETVTTRMVRIDAEQTTGGNTGASEIEIYGP